MSKQVVSNGIPRREFLRISSAAAMGLAVAAISEPRLFAAGSSGITPLMDVGYAPLLPAAGYSVPLASASSILSPDPRFIRSGARIAVVGAKRAARHANAPGGIAVDALFSVSHRRPDDPLRFNFFSVSGRPDHDAMSGPLAFTVQVPSTSGVSFTVRSQRPTQAETTALPPLEADASQLTLSLGNVAGPKLARGVYVLAFREEEGDSMADWRRMAITPVESGYAISGATFSYLILNVDYADTAEVPDRRRASH
ncbi:MAG TPA: hypothetical protein VF713_12450 [Thermoanaerobaculia bacterium]